MVKAKVAITEAGKGGEPMSVEEAIGAYIFEKGIKLSVMAERTGISYGSLYNSLKNKKRSRKLQANELIAVCAFLGINPAEFYE